MNEHPESTFLLPNAQPLLQLCLYATVPRVDKQILPRVCFRNVCEITYTAIEKH